MQAKLITVNGKPLGGGALPIIITPLVGRTKAAVLDEVAAIVPKKPDLLEWRIDFFEGIGDTRLIHRYRARDQVGVRRHTGPARRAATRPRVENRFPIAEPAVVAMYHGSVQGALRRVDRLRALQCVRGSGSNCAPFRRKTASR